MKILTEQCELKLVEMLPSIAQAQQLWMSVHVNLSLVHETMLKQEELSLSALNKMKDMSMKLAEKLMELGLNNFTGNILLFEDGDIVALFLLKPELVGPISDKISAEFKKNGLIHLLKIERLETKFPELIALSQQKQLTLPEYRMKLMKAKISDDPFNAMIPEELIKQSIKEKRRDRKTPCVLIVEDDTNMRNLLNNMLKTEYQVVQAKNGAEGVIAYMEHAPDFVLLDINMPELNGHETLRRMKQIDPKAYIVMLSGASTQTNVVASHYSGAAGFLRKPFSKDKLYEYLSQISPDKRVNQN